MTSESSSGAGPSYCGHCGAAMEPGRPVCGACGRLAADATPPAAGSPPPDYIPYCRNCGVGVPWGAGHTCRRCGVTPLCPLHFRSPAGLCLDCAAAPADATSPYVVGQRCRACAVPLSPGAGFCPNCGQPVTAAAATAEYMGFWIRFAAFAIDWITVYITAALTAAVIGISLTSGEIDPAAMDDISVAFANLNYSFLLLFWGMSAVYGLVMTAWRGQTLGKMLLRIQVVDASGNIPPWHRVLLRELLRGAVLLALFPLGLLYVWVALDARKRGLQDYLGGSYVVRKRRPNPPNSGYN